MMDLYDKMSEYEYKKVERVVDRVKSSGVYFNSSLDRYEHWVVDGSLKILTGWIDSYAAYQNNGEPYRRWERQNSYGFTYAHSRLRRDIGWLGEYAAAALDLRQSWPWFPSRE